MAQPRLNDLLGVQALRAVAALPVGACHAVEQWTTNQPGHGSGQYWPNGSVRVDIFFVISGLVMTISIRRNTGRAHPARTFAKDRIISIVPLYWLVTTLKIVAVAAYAVAVSDGGFASTIVLAFLFGSAIGSANPRLQALPQVPGLGVGAIAFVVLLIVPPGNGLMRPLIWGVPAVMIVAAAVSTEMTLRRVMPRWLLAAGNASYATYLTHGLIVPAVYMLCTRSIAFDAAGLAATIILSLFFSGIVGQIFHSAIEQPLLLRLRTRRPVSTLPAPG